MDKLFKIFKTSQLLNFQNESITQNFQNEPTTMNSLDFHNFIFVL